MQAKQRKRAILGLVVLAAAIVLLIWLYFFVTRPLTPQLPSPPLKSVARERGILVGNYASLNLLHEKPFIDILTSQFEFATVDGDLNWTFNRGSLRPARDRYDFSAPDTVVAFAYQHNMPIQAHHFVWGEEKWLPAWLKEGKFDPSTLLKIMEDHIKTVGTHYKGRIREWTVVNEAFTRAQGVNGLRDWWRDAIGDDSYIDRAFRWAHEADPSAKLILNDFNNEMSNSVSNAMYDYIKAAKARGVPVDGLGMQMHIDGYHPPKKEEVIKNMKRFGELGVEVYVTEFDVNMSGVRGNKKDRFASEAKLYRDMAEACIESDACHSFGLLGITDKESWYNDMGIKHAQPLPFDERYRPKPAFYALREAFAQ